MMRLRIFYVAVEGGLTMTRDQRHGNRRGPGGRRERRLVVRGVRRSKPDLRRLSRTLIALALEEAAAEAAAAEQSTSPKPPASDGDDSPGSHEDRP